MRPARGRRGRAPSAGTGRRGSLEDEGVAIGLPRRKLVGLRRQPWRRARTGVWGRRGRARGGAVARRPTRAHAARVGARRADRPTSDGLRTGPAGTSAGRRTRRLRGPARAGAIICRAAQENIELICKLELETPARSVQPGHGRARPDQPGLVPGQIADVSVYKNPAVPGLLGGAACKRGGFFSVDISNPAARSSSRSCRRCPAPTTARART